MESSEAIELEPWAVSAVGGLAILRARLEHSVEELSRGLGLSPCPHGWTLLEPAIRQQLAQEPMPPWASPDLTKAVVTEALDQCGVFLGDAHELVVAASRRNTTTPDRFDKQMMRRVPVAEAEYSATANEGFRLLELIDSFQDSLVMRRIDGGDTYGFHTAARDLYEAATNPQASPDLRPASPKR